MNINSVSLPGMYVPYKKGTYPNFYQRPMSDPAYYPNSTPQCCSGLASDIGPIEEKQTDWELRISNTADNAGMTQSHARDIRYRRMREINSLCASK